MAEREHILITGASGFLGTWLSEAAHEQGFGLIGVGSAAPRRPEIFSAFVREHCANVDFGALVGARRLRTVFHLAGGASVSRSVENPVGDFASLLPGTTALTVYLMRQQREAHLILFSSAAVYGNTTKLPISETAPVAPISPYGIHKAVAECLVKHYGRISGTRASFLRIFSAYGEGLRKQVLWDICQKAMTAQEKGERFIPIQGTGNETRDFIHATDVARAALLVAAHPPRTGSQIINVASGVETSIRTLAASVMSELTCSVETVFNGMTRMGDPINWHADITTLRNLGFTASIPLAKGIARSVCWQKSLARP
jgi:UDP-glucose 4-epimerase